MLLTEVKRLFCFIWECLIQDFFSPQFHDRNLGLITTSVHLINLLDGMQVKEEPLLIGKDVDFVKYIVCAVFFVWEVMWCMMSP